MFKWIRHNNWWNCIRVQTNGNEVCVGMIKGQIEDDGETVFLADCPQNFPIGRYSTLNQAKEELEAAAEKLGDVC